MDTIELLGTLKALQTDNTGADRDLKLLQAGTTGTGDDTLHLRLLHF